MMQDIGNLQIKIRECKETLENIEERYTKLSKKMDENIELSVALIKKVDERIKQINDDEVIRRTEMICKSLWENNITDELKLHRSTVREHLNSIDGEVKIFMNDISIAQSIIINFLISKNIIEQKEFAEYQSKVINEVTLLREKNKISGIKDTIVIKKGNQK